MLKGKIKCSFDDTNSAYEKVLMPQCKREKKKNSRPQPKKYYEIYDNKNILTVSGLYVATHAFEATTKITGLLICHKLLVS